MTKFGASSLSSAAAITAYPLALSGSATLSASATLVSVSKLTLQPASLTTGPVTIEALGVVEMSAAASINTDGAFSSGFTQGFVRGSRVIGTAFVGRNHLENIATVTANGTVERIGGPAPMSAIATLTGDLERLDNIIPLFANIQSTGSLVGNSVLLHGGSVSLNPIALLQGVGSTTSDIPDIVAFTLYIDKLRGIDGYISRTKNITGYVDKQLNITANIDKASGITGYIDKVVEKTLVRER